MMRASIRRTMRIVLATQKEQLRSEVEYLANFWSDIFSAFTFIVTQTLFIHIIFRRAGLVAGYDQNDFFFLMFVNQITYFTTTRLLALPMYLLVDSVRFGSFDLMLLRPINLKAYLYARAIKPVSAVISSLPSIIFFGVIVNWSKLSISLKSLLLGSAVWVAGFIIFRTYIFALAYPVFTEGDATDSLSGFYWTSAVNEMPFQNLPRFMKVLSLFLIPTLLMTAGTVAVILQRGSAAAIIIPAVLASIVSSILYRLMWRKALTNYMSASS